MNSLINSNGIRCIINYSKTNFKLPDHEKQHITVHSSPNFLVGMYS
jgi:hypothetical protein